MKTLELTIEDEELYSELLRESRELGISLNDAVAQAIREWLLVLEEDREDIGIAEERIADYERTGEYVSQQEVLKDLGLTGEGDTSS